MFWCRVLKKIVGLKDKVKRQQWIYCKEKSSTCGPGKIQFTLLMCFKTSLLDQSPSENVIIIMSYRQHRSPWASLVTRLYHPSLPVGLQGYILYRHRAVVYRFELIVLPFVVHVKGSTGVCHYMTSSLLLQQCPPCLVRLTWIVFMMGSRWAYSCCFVGCCL